MVNTSQFSNYLKIGRNHIFLNVYPHNMTYIDELCQLDHNQRIHIFLSNAESVNAFRSKVPQVPTLIWILQSIANYDYDMKQADPKYPGHRKIIIHIPAGLSDLYHLLYWDFDKCFEGVDMQRGSMYDICEVFIERNGPSFRNPSTKQLINVTYTGSEINVGIILRRTRLEEFHMVPSKFYPLYKTIPSL